MKGNRAHEATVRDLQAERASALARASERLEAALAELAAADAARASKPSSTADARRREALAEARERLWYLVIQREAVGLRRHETLYEVLRIPREVRSAMGPRRAR
ncbi:MAG TPA: DUF6665 family protein [Anaeromyxobacter sp.]|nr:DUF6665 family protein [Anaeromyxobacter sp.]